MNAEVELKPSGGYIQFYSDHLKLTDERNREIAANEIIAYRNQDIDNTFPYRIVTIMGVVSMIVGFALGTLPGYSLWRTLAFFVFLFIVSTLPYLWKYKQHTGNAGVELLVEDDEDAILIEVTEDNYQTVRSNLDAIIAEE